MILNNKPSDFLRVCTRVFPTIYGTVQLYHHMFAFNNGLYSKKKKKVWGPVSSLAQAFHCIAPRGSLLAHWLASHVTPAGIRAAKLTRKKSNVIDCLLIYKDNIIRSYSKTELLLTPQYPTGVRYGERSPLSCQLAS